MATKPVVVATEVAREGASGGLAWGGRRALKALRQADIAREAGRLDVSTPEELVRTATVSVRRLARTTPVRLQVLVAASP